MAKKENTTSIGFEDAIWRAADKLRGNLNASEYEGVVLGLIFLKYISDEFDAKFGKEFGVKFGVKFGVNERKVLLLLASNPSLSAENIAAQIGLTKRGVEKQLKKFRDLGIITRKGSDKTGYWKVTI